MVGLIDIPYVTNREDEQYEAEKKRIIASGEEIKKLLEEGYHPITDSEHFAGGEER